MSEKRRRRSPEKPKFAVDREELGISSGWAEQYRPPAPAPATSTDAAGGGDKCVKLRTSDELYATEDTPATAELYGTAQRHSTVEIDAPVSDNTAPAATPEAQHDTTVPLRSPDRGRRKPLRRVADGLTPAELAIYNVMLREQTPEGLYRGGYNDLCQLTGLSKRGVQNSIAELREKGAITIDKSPGHHRSEVSVYKVATERQILESWHEAGHREVIGRGRILWPPKSTVP